MPDFFKLGYTIWCDLIVNVEESIIGNLPIKNLNFGDAQYKHHLPDNKDVLYYRLMPGTIW